MSIRLNQEDDGKVLAVHVSGTLVKEDYEYFVPEFERLVRQHGKLRLLFDMTGFHGWEVSAAWEDFKFGVKHFSDIERIAMVGEKSWQHGMATFCKPFTKAEIRYFDHADAIEARRWLSDFGRTRYQENALSGQPAFAASQVNHRIPYTICLALDMPRPLNILRSRNMLRLVRSWQSSQLFSLFPGIPRS